MNSSDKDGVPNEILQRVLGTELSAAGYDMLDLVPIPNRVDRMVRLRTLEEALSDFDGETISYLVQVRARSRTEAQTKTPTKAEESLLSRMVVETYEELPNPTESPNEQLYLPNGKVNIEFLARNARILYEARDYALARNIYGTILRSGQRSAFAHLWMGRCYEAEGKVDQAEKHFRESIAFQASLDACQRLAALLIRKKQDQQAAIVMERALALKSLSPTARFELHKACGNCWMRSDQPAQAEKQYRKALEIQPGSDAILANLGALSLQLGRIEDAAKNFQAALAINASNDKALSGLGSCALARGDKRAAHDHFAKSLAIELNNPSAIYHLVKCAYELKSYATAARVVSEYVQVAPVNMNLLYSLSGLQYHLGRLNVALTTVEKVLAINPEHAGAVELKKMILNFGTNNG